MIQSFNLTHFQMFNRIEFILVFVFNIVNDFTPEEEAQAHFGELHQHGPGSGALLLVESAASCPVPLALAFGQ